MARSVTAAKGGSSRNRGILMLAVVFGLLSAVLMFAFLRSQGGDGGTDDLFDDGTAAQSVVITTRTINAGERITSDMLTTKTIAGSALLEGYYTESDELVGKIATTTIVAGEQLVPLKVTSFEGENSLSYKVPDGMRGLSLMVPHEAWIVGGMVQPGDRVDVVGITTLVTVDPLTGQEKIEFVTGIIAEDVEVLAAAQTQIARVPNLDEESTSGSSDPTDTSGTTSEPTTSGGEIQEAGSYELSISVTLALPPEAASKVALIDAMKDDDGQYRLIVRQKGDGTPIEGQKTWTLDDIFTRGG